MKKEAKQNEREGENEERFIFPSVRIFAPLGALWTFGCIDRPSSHPPRPPTTPAYTSTSRRLLLSSTSTSRHSGSSFRLLQPRDGNRPSLFPLQLYAPLLFGHGIFQHGWDIFILRIIHPSLFDSISFFLGGGFLFFSSFICLFVEIGFLYFAIFARETRSSKRVRKWSKFDKVSPARTTRFYPPLGKFEFPAMNLIIEFGQISQKNIFTKISRGMKMVSKLVDQGSPFQPFPESESLFSSQRFLFPASWRSKRVLELPFPPFNRERTKFPFLTNTSLR